MSKKYFMFLSLLVFIFVAIILISALTFIDNSQSNLNSRTYNFTSYNSSVQSKQVENRLVEINQPVKLKAQTIEVIKAEHLNENKEFISDIYNEVKELDNVWSKLINSGEYVRITFEKNLTNKNDITIYPRVVSGNPKIEIYDVDENKKIGEFSLLKSNQYNKVLLTNLQGIQDTFDLRVLNGSVEIDNIIDPSGFDIPSGYISWWRFEGNANDQNGINNGTVNGATYNASGKFGGDYM
ncbi:MAG: hypothetical protein WCI72_03450, partial [archaeon]